MLTSTVRRRLLPLLVIALVSAVASCGSDSADAPSRLGSQAVQRTPVRTSLGDPARLEICDVIEAPIAVGGGSVEPVDLRPLGACFWAADYGNADFRVEASFVSPGQISAGALLRRVGSVQIRATPGRSDGCLRLATAKDYQVLFTAGTADGMLDTGEKCTLVDFLVTKVAGLLASGKVPHRALATPSLATVDLCAAVPTATAAKLLGAATATHISFSSGMKCTWTAGATTIAVRAITSANYGMKVAATRRVAGHALSGDSGPGFCSRSSKQGKVTATDGAEYVTVDVTGPGDTCGIADRAAVALLDAAGLH